MSRYAISDLHGYLDLFKKVKKQLSPSDILYVLGDCGDRGPQSWETLKSVLEDQQCILIIGNHEVMLRDTMEMWFKIVEKKTIEPEDCELTSEEIADEDIIWTHAYQLLCMNGGEDTFWSWRAEADLQYWYRRLKCLPLEVELYKLDGRRLILTHAGYTPWKRPKTEDDYVWGRDHFFDKWLEEDSSIIIHGHTMNEYMVEELVDSCSFFDKEYYLEDFEDLTTDLKKIIYADGHKYDIDAGTILTKKIIMLDLETLEWKVIM